ncbi:MAG: phosphoribosylglycinamide formyltransferase [Alphaproteobacteria bacterium]|nr:MAG: phosphoribosylglycinamide formyltransferase [Alphaproteobacteria bacterium]
MKRLAIAVLISGRGTNLQALIDACADPDFPASIACVISNRPDAHGLQRARNANIPTRVVNHKEYETREAFEEALDEAVREFDVGLVCLAGFMRILTPAFVNRWRDRMINIHPSLLPAFRGLHTHERVIEAGVRITGCTVHYVTPEMDDGPIIIQAAVPVREDDSAEELAERVLMMEHKIYPEAVRLVALGKVRVAGTKVATEDAVFADNNLINPVAE